MKYTYFRHEGKWRIHNWQGGEYHTAFCPNNMSMVVRRDLETDDIKWVVRQGALDLTNGVAHTLEQGKKKAETKLRHETKKVSKKNKRRRMDVEERASIGKNKERQ